MSDYFVTRERLRARYSAPRIVPIESPRGEAIGGDGFLTEIAGRVILTAPASTFTLASELPGDLGERWEKSASGNEHMMWLQGRFVEGEKANRNGAFWSTEDLQFGEMSVRHGPLNWLHEERTVVGTIADNALIHPQATQLASTAASISLVDRPMPRPYIAAVSAVWRWVHPEKAYTIERAADDNKLFYSMECIAREMACVTDSGHEGCGQKFDYILAMTQPEKTCEHIAARTSARRLIDPCFLGGAVIVPPSQPGWGSANVEVMRHAAALAEQTHASAHGMQDRDWESLMAQVVQFATTKQT